MEAAAPYCLDLISKEDRQLYSALLFLPESARQGAAAICAFHREIDRIPFLVKEPMPGEIRLQWWRDVVSGDRENEAQSNPLAKALLFVIEKHQLPKEGFLRYLDAKTFDLYNDPMPDRNTLEAYLGETESFIYQMIAMISDVKNNPDLANACGHAGVATGIAKILSRLAHDHSYRKVFIPGDLLTACGLDAASWLSEPSQKHETVVQGFLALGQEHILKAKSAIRGLPKEGRVVFLPLAFTKVRFEEVTRSSGSLTGDTELSPLRCQLALWKTAIMGF